METESFELDFPLALHVSHITPISLNTHRSLYSHRSLHSNWVFPLTRTLPSHSHFKISLTLIVSLTLSFTHSHFKLPSYLTLQTSKTHRFVAPLVCRSVALLLCILGGSAGRDSTSITSEDSLSLHSVCLVFGFWEIWQNWQISISLYLVFF